MFQGIFYLIQGAVDELTKHTVDLIDNAFSFPFDSDSLITRTFDLTLFSDTPIISMTIHEFLQLFFSTFYSMFLIILLYKATKKFINMVFGVFKL